MSYTSLLAQTLFFASIRSSVGGAIISLSSDAKKGSYPLYYRSNAKEIVLHIWFVECWVSQEVLVVLVLVVFELVLVPLLLGFLDLL